MIRVLLGVLALVTFTACAPGLAPPNVETRKYGQVVSDVALNAPPDTGWIETDGWSGLRLDIAATRAAYTTVTVACVQSDNQSTEFKIPETVSGGAMSQFTGTWTVSASVNFSPVINVAGYRYVKCTFGGASAGATDKVTVTAYLTRGI